ncbi:MAG TPA: tetratricopeptide repeat protein [Drouetiella sp.]|jgi:tetratricopeptide (TPR) repeat protein
MQFLRINTVFKALVVAGMVVNVSAPAYAAGDATLRGEFNRVSTVSRGGGGLANAGSLDLDSLGRQAMRKGDYKGAINYYTQAITQDPQNVRAVLDRADARRLCGDYLNAISDYSMLRIAPLQADNLVNIGYCHGGLNNFRASMDDFTNSLALNSTGETAAAAYAGRAATKRVFHDTAGALADCDAALRIDPNSSDARFQRAVTYLLAQQYQKAVDDLNIVVAKEPRFAEGHLRLAQCYEKLGNKSSAIAEYRKANYLYQQAHDTDGIEQTNAALKVLQANASHRDSDVEVGVN